MSAALLRHMERWRWAGCHHILHTRMEAFAQASAKEKAGRGCRTTNQYPGHVLGVCADRLPAPFSRNVFPQDSRSAVPTFEALGFGRKKPLESAAT